MKKIVSLGMALVLFVSICQVQLMAATSNQEMRGVWISTVYNLDYPSTKNNIESQKSEFIQKLDALQQLGINAVFVQVRPKADALYFSSINPWSDVLTGTQGKDPGYDPLAFMINEAHKRGMEFHAWLNPYRVTTSGTDLAVLSVNHPARLNPSWTFAYNNALYYNPQVEAVKEHIVATVTELAINYDMDGIHFDDYFYPSSYPLPAGESRDGAVANGRREAVNDMVHRVSNAIRSVNKTYNKKISFGISPAGIWKNSTSDATGSNTSGNEAYYSIYADSRTWIKNGWVDYIAPQIYWKIGHAKADYKTLVDWWSNEVAGTNVKLYIGQGIYSDEVASQIDAQLVVNQNNGQVKGSIYFSLRDLLNNRMQSKDKIALAYQAHPVSGAGSTGSSTTTSTGIVALATAVGKTGTVTASTLNIRAGARVDRAVVAKATSGTKLTILSTLGEWYKIKLSNGLVGWANAAYIHVNTGTTTTASTSTTTSTSTFPKVGTVTASTLNVRSGARTDRSIVTKLKSGNRVTVLSSLGDWYKIKASNGKIGWCVKSYIK